MGHYTDGILRVWNLQHPDIHKIQKFDFGYKTVNDLQVSRLDTKKISNIRKMLTHWAAMPPPPVHPTKFLYLGINWPPPGSNNI